MRCPSCAEPNRPALGDPRGEARVHEARELFATLGAEPMVAQADAHLGDAAVATS